MLIKELDISSTKIKFAQLQYEGSTKPVPALNHLREAAKAQKHEYHNKNLSGRDKITFAMTLYTLSLLQKADEIPQTASQMKELFQEFPEDRDLAAIYAVILTEQLDHTATEDEAAAITKELNDLESRFPDDQTIAILNTRVDLTNLTKRFQKDPEQVLEHVISRLQKFPYNTSLALHLLTILQMVPGRSSVPVWDDEQISMEDLLNLGEEKAPELDVFGHLALACGMQATTGDPENDQVGEARIKELAELAKKRNLPESVMVWCLAGSCGFTSRKMRKFLNQELEKLIQDEKLETHLELALPCASAMARTAEVDNNHINPDWIPILENLLHACHGDQRIAICLAEVLANHVEPYSCKNIAMLRRLSDLCKAYPDCEEIASCFAYKLDDMVYRLDESDQQDYLEQTRALSQKFPGVLTLADMVDQLNDLTGISDDDLDDIFGIDDFMDDYSRAEEDIDSLKSQLEMDPDNESIATQLADALEKMAELPGSDSVEFCVEELENLHRRFPDVTEITVCLSETLLIMQDQDDLFEEDGLVKMQEIFRKLFDLSVQEPKNRELSSNFIEAVYTFYHFNRIAEEISSMAVFLEQLAQEHPQSVWAAMAWCTALAGLSEYQTPQEREKSLEKIEEIRSRFPLEKWIRSRAADILWDNAIDQMAAPGSKKSRQLDLAENLLSQNYDVLQELGRSVGQRYPALSAESARNVLDSLFQLIRTSRNSEAALCALSKALAAIAFEGSQKARLKILKQLGTLYRNHPGSQPIAESYCTALAAMSSSQTIREQKATLDKMDQIKAKFADPDEDASLFTISILQTMNNLYFKQTDEDQNDTYAQMMILMKLARMERETWVIHSLEEDLEFDRKMTELAEFL